MNTYFSLWRISGIVFCFVISLVLGTNYVCYATDPPQGSYLKTCKEILANESDITRAQCKKMNGNWNKNAKLMNYKKCQNDSGEIENCDGNLRCTSIGIPTVGSYQRSCFCCSMTGNQLSCYCNPKKGNAKLTTLNNANACKNPWNDNGKLKCN